MKNWCKLKMAIFVFATVVVMAAVVMWLWNWLIPVLFNGPVITFLQAAGLMLLSRILFRGFTGMKGRGMYYSRGWKERLDKMSSEEREKMRELWKKRCGGFSCDDDDEK